MNNRASETLRISTCPARPEKTPGATIVKASRKLDMEVFVMATYLMFGTLAQASRLLDINFHTASAVDIDAFDKRAAA